MSVDRAAAYRIFDAALALTAEQRAGFLDAQCGSDRALRAEVEELLRVAARDPLTAAALRAQRPAAAAEDLCGREFGHFRLVERIGAGGMGVVYRAERTADVQQQVAIKLLPAPAAGTVTVFEREARLLARLEHPAIARFIDCGVQDGQAWIAIEFVHGEPIDRWCETHAVSLPERVRLLATLADAVAAAHRLLVVHRDIKPGNVLVDQEGQPRLIDFGIAATLAPGAEHADPTVDLSSLFTPGYAAPEQVLGEPPTVATDIYCLGALAYRLLAGSAPHAGAEGAIRYSLAVLEQDPEPPSVRAARSSPQLARALRGDLDAILMMALARDPARRYASAQDFAADLHRHLAHEPVLAQPPALLYRLRKLIQRRTLAVVTTTLLVLAVAAAAAVYGVQARRVQLANAMTARRGEFLENLLASADPRGGKRDITVAELLDKAAGQSDTQLASEPLVAASLLGLLATTNDGLGRFEAALAASDRQLALLRRNGGSAADLVDALDNRGDALNRLSRLPEAEAALREAVRLADGRCDAEGALAQSYDLLGIVLANSKHEREAEQDYRASIACYRRLGGQLALKAAYPLDNLQVLLDNQGHYDESLVAGTEALALTRQLNGASHPDTASIELNYSGTLVNLHRLTEAEPLLRDALAQRQRLLGAEHSDTLMAATSLADLLNEEHHYAEAAQLERPTAETFARINGPTHPLTLYAWGVYALAACSSGTAEAGLQAAHLTLAGRTQRYGADDARTQSTAVTIGSCLIALKRFAEAEAVLQHAATVLEAARGASFLRTQAAYQGLRDLYLAEGQPALAAQWARKLTPTGQSGH